MPSDWRSQADNGYWQDKRHEIAELARQLDPVELQRIVIALCEQGDLDLSHLVATLTGRLRGALEAQQDRQ